METTKITEKMPEIVKETIGQAQARLTTWEGEARKIIEQTWTRINDWHKTQINQVETATNDLHNKAIHGMGLASHADIEQVSKQINRLRNEVKKLNKKNSRSRNTKTSTRTNAKSTKTAEKSASTRKTGGRSRSRSRSRTKKS